MDLNTKRDFNRLVNQFHNEFSLATISEVINLVRVHQRDLNVKQIKILLEIPRNVLNKDVELIKSEAEWSKKNYSYFLGNITGSLDDKFVLKWQPVFQKPEFGLGELSEYLDDIITDLEENQTINDFWLRNVEVTIRDDVKLFSYSDFKTSGRVFANEILKVIN